MDLENAAQSNINLGIKCSPAAEWLIQLLEKNNMSPVRPNKKTKTCLASPPASYLEAASFLFYKKICLRSQKEKNHLEKNRLASCIKKCVGGPFEKKGPPSFFKKGGR